MQIVDGVPVYAATDLVGFLACSHRLALERAALAGLVRKPIRDDPTIDLIAKRGEAHERRYLALLRGQGRTIVEVDRDAPDGGPRDLRARAAETDAALRAGVDVVYQATFFDGRWVGHADFVQRVERPSRLGPWSYEVADTKLARRAKGGAILQICSYVEQLERLQGLQPAEMHVVLGGSESRVETFRVSDFMAYYRQVKAAFEAAVEAGEAVYPVTASYPEPVEHCEVCNWAVHCREQRHRDDDLSRVAGITAHQRRALKAQGIATRRGLASIDVPLRPRLDGVSDTALERIHDQARIQVLGEDEGRPRWELLEPELDDTGTFVRDRGFLSLPPPSPGDLFFDIEGDPFALDDGVEYLFGVLDPASRDAERPDEPTYQELWSRDPDGEVTRTGEKRAFEELVDLLIARLDAEPAMHVYHYATYERAALGRLAQRHATRELEVDRLLRGGVLVDLYRVVRQGLRASVESYSIKRLEPLYGLEREVELRTAGSSIVAFEAWLEGQEFRVGEGDEDGPIEAGEAILRTIAGYNRDDVVSNWRLRDWLEVQRAALERGLGVALPRPGASPDAEPREPSDRERRTAELGSALSADVPADPRARDDDQAARWLLAQLLGFHRREDKAFWWRYFYLCGLSDDELVDEREPLGAIHLEADLGPSGKGGRRQAFSFPPQDHRLGEGDGVADPRTRARTGTIVSIDDVARRVELRRTATEVARGLPSSLVPSEHYRIEALEDSIARTAESVLAGGIDGTGGVRAGRDLLLRRPPRLEPARGGDGQGLHRPAGATEGGADPPGLGRDGETGLDAARRLAPRLDRGTLAIQGPPGSGKTYTGARMILDLVRRGRRVGVTANSHKVIGNLLDKLAQAALEEPVPGERPIRIGQVPAPDAEPTCSAAARLDWKAARDQLARHQVDVVGGTAWVWSREELVGAVEVLVIDEAGQMSLATTLAVAPAAESLVLLGDPQQLDQPLQGSHPPGAEKSALAHLLGERATMPRDRGLFLERTWRLHPAVCAFTSEVFYASQLTPETGMERQTVEGSREIPRPGVHWLPVEHAGNAVESPEEAGLVTRIVGDLLAGGVTWRDPKGREAFLGPEHVLVVAPYNAHVERIADRLRRAGLGAVRVGTVDKFQGQEAPVSIYAMASSSAEEAPRGMEFLYSLNRLNVATSRARWAALVVASPRLIEVQCQTPRQMRLANALCRFVEVAGQQDRGSG
ncbi:MAG TPA: TM0106 family RecB-like putative nuclease [Candidatus Limnocylindrales bacterium]|nr:TM0106 family RecB-like putative nuclease [Candidatus Limnocylindrales bacterium]